MFICDVIMSTRVTRLRKKKRQSQYSKHAPCWFVIPRAELSLFFPVKMFWVCAIFQVLLVNFHAQLLDKTCPQKWCVSSRFSNVITSPDGESRKCRDAEGTREDDVNGLVASLMKPDGGEYCHSLSCFPLQWATTRTHKQDTRQNNREKTLATMTTTIAFGKLICLPQGYVQQKEITTRKHNWSSSSSSTQLNV